MRKIAQGAEAILYKKGNLLIKERLEKPYRISILDKKLRKFRTRRESKVLKKLEEINFPAPRLKEFNDSSMQITMDFLDGSKLKDILNEKNILKFAKFIGKNISDLHENNIIHGDLTTSNMIYNKKLYFIDFGLSFFSEKIEDKAVDLFLLERAISSIHYKFPNFFQKILNNYSDSNVKDRLLVVQKRGRNKKS